MALVQVADVVVPEIFAPYLQQLTETKSRMIQSGAVAVDPAIVENLMGGGNVFNIPSWQDLADTDSNVSSDDAAGVNDSVADKTVTSQEVAVRLSRNKSWSSADLASNLAGSDPMDSIAQRVASWWTRDLQKAMIATVTGILADNVANDASDMTVDISGGAYAAGVTDFSAEAFIDAKQTMGDSQDDLGMVMMHSAVYSRAQKNNLIDFIPDSEGRVSIPTYLGLMVIVDDSLPNAGGIFDTWLFGSGALRFGQSSPRVPVEIERKPEAGNGGGQELLFNRTQWSIHPTGFAYVGAATGGGPTNATLAAAASWDRVYPERKQIKIARLITRES
ncbi:MAG: hypothetical protein F6K62_14540 [Sphaerospermopsis sp. SIO1G2]|nr:hypothetical protein [Sphaerospermopsis sp. SIO1G2]